MKNYIQNSYSKTSDSYNTYYLKPDYNINNKNNISITNAFAYAYKPLFKRTRINFTTTKIELPKQLYFTITLKKGDVGFYISIPSDFDTLIRGKMATVWPNTELRPQEPQLLTQYTNAAIGELVQSDYSFKSLNCATDNLYPLTNLLGVTKTLTDKQEVRITFVIESFGKHNWLERQKLQVSNYLSGKTCGIEKSTNEKLFDAGIRVGEFAIDTFIEMNEFLFDSIFGFFENPPKKQDKKANNIHVTINDRLDMPKIADLSTHTRSKLKGDVFTSRILISATGGNIEQNRISVASVANAYKDLEADNSLNLKYIPRKDTPNLLGDINSRLVKVNKQFILSDREVAKFIQLPQKDLQKEFKLNSIDTRECEVPEALQNGKVRVGTAENKGKSIVATFNDNYNVVPRTVSIVGPQGSGKTTILKRISSDNYKAGYANFILDYVESCETAKDVAKAIPVKDKVIYDVGARGSRLSLSFNEVSKHIKENMDVWDRIRYANLLADQLELILNAIKTDSTSELTSPMMRYLHSASMITFIKPGATINDVFKVIKNHKFRAEMVSYAQKSRCFRLDDEIFSDLAEINKLEKGNVVGTRTDLTVGIENRISMLLKNPDMKEMLNNDVDVTDDFTEHIASGKTIIVMIPQHRFPNEQIRDVLAVYYFSRLWLACQLRTENKTARLCNVVIDEVGQVEILSKFIGQYCTEFRRHRIGLTLAMHHLQQMKGLLKQLTSSGSSYMLLAGIEKKNIEALKEEIQPFTLEEVLNLKTHTSLNVINYGNQYAKFITRQPKN